MSGGLGETVVCFWYMFWWRVIESLLDSGMTTKETLLSFDTLPNNPERAVGPAQSYGGGSCWVAVLPTSTRPKFRRGILQLLLQERSIERELIREKERLRDKDRESQSKSEWETITPNTIVGHGMQ